MSGHGGGRSQVDMRVGCGIAFLDVDWLKIMPRASALLVTHRRTPVYNRPLVEVEVAVHCADALLNTPAKSGRAAEHPGHVQRLAVMDVR